MSTPPLTQTVAALAILLSVIVRWIRSGASWHAVDEGRATAETLRDITGLMEFVRLQETSGPPQIRYGFLPVTPRELKCHRTGLGFLLGNRWLDGGCAIVALVALLPIWPM